MNILSFGGGIQTVAMALMCINKELPMPDCAIFADPKWEHEETYKYLSWFIPYCEEQGLKFYVVSKGNIRVEALDTQKRWATMPLFTLSESGEKGMLRRQCTNEYKVSVVYKKVRELMGLKKYQRTKNPANIWIGYTLDEADREKPSRVGYCKNVFPLLYDRPTKRRECEKYILDNGFYLPPKSACIGCPYCGDDRWKDLKKNNPKLFEDACQFDDAVRNNTRKGIKAQVFLHSRRIPLRDIKFFDGQIDMFTEECEGHCGL